MKEIINVDNLIYEIRNKKVIMDSDIAILYGVETKTINQTVKRNIEKFNDLIYFQLTAEEYNSLRSQNVTLEKSGLGKHRKYLPYVFTIEGVKTISLLYRKENINNATHLIIRSFEKADIKILKTSENTDKIENLIYEIRGKQVMLDFDLARLYECKNGTKTINLAVKRHISRFPELFMFQLTEEECKSVSRFQIETLKERGHNIKYLPYAFTEQGVAMLSTVLRTKVAEEVSINIMDAFVAMRHYIGNNENRLSNVESKLLEHDKCLRELKETFKQFDEKKKINEIYFNGQIYDAYSKILNIFKEAKKNLIIIDGYADNTLLDIVKRLDINATLIAKPNCLLTKQDLKKYNQQYNNLKVIFDDTFHDRYFILDERKVYHCGTSINRIGYKTFSITLLNDKELCDLLLNKVMSMIKSVKY